MGYPRGPLVFVACMAVFVLIWIYGVAFMVPAEERVIAHGAHIEAAVETVRIQHRRKDDEYLANLSWTDTHGSAHTEQVSIGERAYARIGSAATTKILYLDDER